jgi:hypothetical protein
MIPCSLAGGFQHFRGASIIRVKASQVQKVAGYTEMGHEGQESPNEAMNREN